MTENERSVLLDEISALTDEAERLREWLRYMRWGVGFYEPDSALKSRILAAIDAALDDAEPPSR